MTFKHPNVHREFVEYSETQKLHIVSVYSNPYRWQRRREIFHDFRFHMETSPNVELHVVEVAFGDRPHEVTTAGNPLDLQLRTDSSLWIKECAAFRQTGNTGATSTAIFISHGMIGRWRRSTCFSTIALFSYSVLMRT